MGEKNDSSIPWEDLRYIFGQIMYGGHIVNDLDRVLCLAYLDFIMDDGLLDEMEMFPFNDGGKETFKCPAPTTYTRYLEYIEEELKEETPVAYGLHPNAQIDFRTLQSKQFFNSVGALTPAETNDDDDEGGGGSGPQHLAENMLNDIMERIEDVNFDVAEVVSMLNEEKTPFQNVFLQEIKQMAELVVEMVASLKELALGFAGELTISDAMDALMMSLFYGTVPTKWTKLVDPHLQVSHPCSQTAERRPCQLGPFSGHRAVEQRHHERIHGIRDGKLAREPECEFLQRSYHLDDQLCHLFDLLQEDILERSFLLVQHAHHLGDVEVDVLNSLHNVIEHVFCQMLRATASASLVVVVVSLSRCQCADGVEELFRLQGTEVDLGVRVEPICDRGLFLQLFLDVPM